MFGEDDSESPRVPSPWSNLISTPPSPSNVPVAQGALIPRLVSEAQDGNVEYKLQLLNPSPARFARLVTQLKWRLLEGGGQAYYELGVADSGALIGLPRVELEMSLETLEMMAGEIGASVIVVKEIEVPEVMTRIGMAEEGVTIVSGGAGAYVKERPDMEDGTKEGIHLTASSEDDSYPSSTETQLDPNRADTETDDFDSDTADPPTLTFDLEISSVYKPRPMRRRPYTHSGAPVKRKGRKQLPFALPVSTNAAQSTSSIADSSNDAGSEASVSARDTSIETKQQAKAAHRRLARDRRREEKRRALLLHVSGGSGEGKGTVEGATNEQVETTVTLPLLPSEHEVEDLTSSLATLHVSLRMPPIPTINLNSKSLEPVSPHDGVLSDHFVTRTTTTAKATTKPVQKEPHLIVEALVVRKLSLEEAFLDFGGFTMIE